MEKFLNASKIRQLDLIAQNKFAIPGLLLMEHASLGLAEVLEALSQSRKDRYLFVCGRGNNGGDGFAAARHLHNRGLKVAVVFMGKMDQIREGSDAAINAVIVRKMGIPISEGETSEEILAAVDLAQPDYLVDSILGTGLSSEVRGMFRDVIEGINSRGLDVTAVDMPSGLDSNTGLPLGAAIKAKRTVTFAFGKAGLTKEEAKQYCGKVIVKGIGLPREVTEDPHAYL